MAEPRKRESTLRPVDEEARSLARRLVRAASAGALGTIEPGSGFPAVSRASVATDFRGSPVLLVSDLSVHTRALRADPRCSILLGEPGDGDPLAFPRITVLGRARFLDRAAEDGRLARARFLARHPQSAFYADFADFHFVLVEPERAGLNGGFARAFEMTAADFVDEESDETLMARAERALAHMNADHADAVDAIASRILGLEAGSGWSIATVDRRGFEIVREGWIERVEFETPVAAPEEFRAAFVALVTGGR